MRETHRRRYLVAGIALVLVSLLSLYLRLDSANAKMILMELRLPRLILGLAVGGGLALAGAVMQTILSNSLAEPYTLGIASGAALGAAVGSSLHVAWSVFGLNVGAVIGAVAVLLTLFKVVAHSDREGDSLILVGVMMSLTCASLLAIWMALASPLGVQSINFWLLGDLSRTSLFPAVSLLSFTLVTAGYFIFTARKLDAFLFGSELVESFGVSREQVRNVSILLVSVLVGFCVSAVGMIGFLGLIVPHLVRRFTRTSLHHVVIPLSVIWGATVLTFSDVLARLAAEPHELPVGAVTAVVGAPVFISIFVRRKRGELA